MGNGRRTAFRQRSDTSRWLIGLMVLGGSLAIYAYEQITRTPDTPIVGSANVADGDTVRIEGTRIRLLDIDAPELEQTCDDPDGKPWPCGEISAGELRKTLRGKTLNCHPRGLDQFRRVLATCSLSDGTNINAWMVRQGWAISFGYARVYGNEESEARLARRGIWRGTFTEPQKWRHQHPREERVDPPK
ncbi:MAG TPA: thermonuclease family protein [Afipia sp.]